jgi:putative hydrolase of the HAD superfamily
MTRHWILDCDNTLYPAQTGLFEHVNRRIDSFMAERLGIREDLISGLRSRYCSEHGITLTGLMRDYPVDPGEYLEYVHEVPVEELIAPDPRLAEILVQLPGEKAIFTNGSCAHAERILARLGVLDHFGGIYDIAFMDYLPKPKEYGYLKLFESLAASPEDCVFFDDVPENLDTGRALGMTTVLVGPHAAPGHLHLPTLHDLPSMQGFRAA